MSSIVFVDFFVDETIVAFVTLSLTLLRDSTKFDLDSSGFGVGGFLFVCSTSKHRFTFPTMRDESKSKSKSTDFSPTSALQLLPIFFSQKLPLNRTEPKTTKD